MVSSSLPARDPHRIRPRAWLYMALITLGSAALYVGVRKGVELGDPNFRGICERLTRGGISVGPRDWMCAATGSRERVLFLAASLAAGLGLAWPPVVLAATGRRLTAFLPLLPVAGGVTVSAATMSLWNGPPRISDGVAAAAIDLALLTAPAAAVAYVVRRRPRPREPELGWLGCLISAGVCAGAAAAILAAIPALFSWHFASGGDPLAISAPTLVPAALVIGIFGALLGSDRRWWPWSLVPPAVLLSLGPSVALLSASGSLRISIWSPFGAVVPLFLVGLAATWWRPMSVALSVWLERTEASDFDDLPEPEDASPSPSVSKARRPFRPGVIPNALAAGVLAVSVVIFIADPYRIAMAEALPTYLGLRTMAQDMRTKADLHRAMAAMAAYLEEHGTDRGFDATDGAQADPTLVWLPTPSTDRQVQAMQASAVTVIASPGHVRRIAAFSESGRAFCIQRSAAGRLAFGVGERSRTGLAAVGAWREALASCGDHPWTASTLAPLPTEGMCDGLGVTYVYCRSVQGWIAEELHSVPVAP